MTDQIPTPTAAPSLPGMPGLPGLPGIAAAAPAAAVPSAPPAAFVPPAAPPAAFVPPAAPPAVPSAPAAAFVPPAAPAAEVPQPTQELMPAAQAPQALVPAQPAQLPVQYDAAGWPVAANMGETFAALGFEGVSFDSFGIVPTIRLDKTEFLKDDAVMPPEFYVTVVSSRPKYLFSYGNMDEKNAPKGVCYSYDKMHDANGDKTIAEFKAEAASHGAPVREAEYYEIDATLLETNEAVKLSVPKRGSGSAFARFLTQCGAVRRRPQDAIVRIKKGDKVTKVDNPFYPWCFEIAGWKE